MGHLSGIQRLLAELPGVTFVVMLAVGIGGIWVLRRASAGEWYNVTYSGQVGDVALTLVVLLGIGVMRSLGEPLPAWLGSLVSQLVLLAACFALGLFVLKFGHRPIWEEQAPEQLHGFLIVPALLYLVTTVVAVTIWAGAWRTLALEAVLIGFWAFLVYVDFKTGRADQVTYHNRTGEYFLFGW